MNARCSALVLLVCALSGCGPLTAISLVDHPDALTRGGSDNLFTLSFNAGGFNVALLGVAANLPGETAVPLRCTAAGPYDQDVTLICSEPAATLFDATTAGKWVTVELFAAKPENRRLSEYTLNSLTWIPAN